jgi:hypothetical protein
MTTEDRIDLRNKILLGLKQAYEKMLEFKKQKNSVVVVIRDNKIVKLKPEEL